MKKVALVLMVFVIFIIAGVVITYNHLITNQEGVSQAWGQIQATYQRRLDLIPNLVATVKGYAKHEQSTLQAVVNARAKASQSLGGSSHRLNDPKQLKQLEATQAALSSAMGRLMVVVERYPDLKASQNFLALQSQIEGTENRINVARQRFNKAVRRYNAAIRRFPGNIVAKWASGFEPKPYFSAQEKAAQAPAVSF